MLLYFNGDSFVAGTELADDMLPGYPGYVSWPINWNKLRTEKIWLDSSHDANHPSNKNRMDIMHQITKNELLRAYPNKVHMVTELPIVNRGMGGSSMDRIARQTLLDLYTLKQEDPDRELIAFIGTTSPWRSEIPNNLPPVIDIHGFTTDWASISTTYRQDDHDEDIENIRRYKILFETTYHSLVNFYRNVVLISDFCKVNNIKLYWIATGEDVTQYAIEEHLRDRPDLKMLVDYTQFKYDINMIEIIAEFPGQHVICPGGHFGEPIHDRTAQEIVKILGELNV
jgi:hypothetical protein